MIGQSDNYPPGMTKEDLEHVHGLPPRTCSCGHHTDEFVECEVCNETVCGDCATDEMWDYNRCRDHVEAEMSKQLSHYNDLIRVLAHHHIDVRRDQYGSPIGIVFEGGTQ